MPKFRKKPVIIEAEQWHFDGDNEVVGYFRHPDYSGEAEHEEGCGNIWRHHGWINTLEGGHIVCPGDWIITGIKGEVYPCKPDIFKATYDRVPDYDPEKHASYYA